MADNKLRTVIFGGSFDPPHLGHIRLASQILNHHLADRILFIPALNPPHKTSGTSASFLDRTNMLELAINSMPSELTNSVFVSTIEGERAGRPSYTYDTMKELEELYPNDELILLIGEDSLRNLHTWYKAEKIADMWSILTYPRPVSDVSETDTLQELMKKWDESVATRLFQSILNVETYPVSSTEIRNKIRLGRDVSNCVDSKVYEYINKKGLYKT